MEIIDAHSHFGTDMIWPNKGVINEYILNAKKKKIDKTLAMSVPCPIFIDENKKIILLKYKHFGETIRYFSVIEDLKTGEKEIIDYKNMINPYKRANDMIYNLCKSNSSFEFVPLIHPYFYSLDDFLINIKRGAKLFKIHGIAGGVIPSEISEDFFRMIESLQIPLLIHTDYSLKENIMFYNDAIHWYNVLKKYNIKVYFAHSVRLMNKMIDIINSDSRYIIGLGPDKYINDPLTPMEKKHVNYLECCFEMFDINKIVFDVDYPWNIISNDNMSLDWDSTERIKLVLSNEEQEKVFSKNIKKFIKR